MKRKRELERGTGSQGKQDSLRVVRWLNDERNSPAERKPLIELMGLIRNTLATIEKTPKRAFVWPYPRRVKSLLEELNTRLENYPRISALAIEDGAWTFETRPWGNPVSENIVVQWLIRLTSEHLLDRIRRCVCGKWFFAARNQRKSCSPKCRHKLYEQTEDYRRKRRKYMRDYYQRYLSGKVK
jgi:hypothetical protein